MNGACNVKLFFAPPPGALERGQKVKYILISITKSQIKDTKHRQDFHSVAWVMPQGWDFGALGVLRGSKKSFSNMVMWH